MNKAWTVMLYLVAEPLPEDIGLRPGTPEDLDLDDAADAEIDAIAKAAREVADQVQVVCQVDFQGRRNVRRLLMEADSTRDVGVDASDLVAEPGDPKVLKHFLEWGSNFPSDRRAVFFWGHSFGPGGMFVTKADPSRHRSRQVIEPGIIANPALFDPSRNESALNLGELASTLKAATPSANGRLDLVVFKDCYMNTLEVAYELSQVVDFQLGSQFAIPIRKKTAAADGSHQPAVWPYHRLFGALANPSTLDPSKAGRAMLDALGDFYAVPDNQLRDKVPDTVPCSLLDLRNIDDVTDELNAFVTKVQAAFPRLDDRSDKILGAKAGDSALMDVVKMCDQFSFPEAANLSHAIRQHIVGHRPGHDRTFNGLSVVYMPPTHDSVVATQLFSTEYQKFDLAKSTHWTDELAFEAQPPMHV